MSTTAMTFKYEADTERALLRWKCGCGEGRYVYGPHGGGYAILCEAIRQASEPCPNQPEWFNGYEDGTCGHEGATERYEDDGDGESGPHISMYGVLCDACDAEYRTERAKDEL